MTELYHLGIEEDPVPAAAVLVEYGLSSEALRRLLDDAASLGAKREFRSILGTVKGHQVLVVDCGVGAPSTCIALEELVRAGTRRIVWIGRRRDPDAQVGDVIVPTAAIRGDGTSLQYAPLAYPAVPDFVLSATLRRELHQPDAVVLVETTDVLDVLPAIVQDLCSAALFVVGAAHSAAIATVLLPETAEHLEEGLAHAVLRAVAISKSGSID